jgi:hypothetical protein
MLLDKVHEGFEVPCPACGHRFLVPPGSTDVAEVPPPPPPPGGGAPPDAYGYVPPPRKSEDSGDGTTILVLGILGVVACQVLAPVAWIMGHKARNAARARGAEPASNVTVGWALGIAGTVLLLLTLGLVAVMLTLALVGSMR